MIPEEIGVNIKTHLGQLIGITDVQLLTPTEYMNQTTPKDWFPENPDGVIVKLHLYGNPENYIIKQISTVCFHTKTQLHYTKNTAESDASTAYICPTQTEFPTLYTISSSPPNPNIF